MSTSFTSYDIRNNPIIVLGYAAYFICGISIAMYELRVLIRVVGDDLVGPYFVTIFLVGIIGLVGVILTFIQRDAFLVLLAGLTICLMVFWRLDEGSISLEIYALIYALITIAIPFISSYYARRIKNRR